MKVFSLKSKDHLGSTEGKRTFNRELFSTIADEYDLMTRLLSFWQDQRWKELLISLTPQFQEPRCLDIACGTGDFTWLLKKRYPTAKIIALDYTERMLVLGRKRLGSDNLLWCRQDIMSLAVKSSSVDLITAGYALRNSPDLNITIIEVARVLKPGGAIAVLDFSKPRNIFGQKIEHFLLKFWGGLWGILLHRNPDSYAYIADSLALFPDRGLLREIFRKHGMEEYHSFRFFFGTAEAVVFIKQPAS